MGVAVWGNGDGVCRSVVGVTEWRCVGGGERRHYRYMQRAGVNGWHSLPPITLIGYPTLIQSPPPLTTHPSTYPPMYRYGDVLAHYQVRDRREVEGVGRGPPQSITTYLPGRCADLRPAHFTLPHFQVRAHLQGRPLPLTAGAIDAIMSAAQVRI